MNEQTGAIYNVVAGVCYLMAWTLTCCTPKPKPLLRKLCCPDKSNDAESPPKAATNNNQVERSK